MSTSAIWKLKDPLGRPRFYPPGKHPATAQLREARDAVERHLAVLPGDPNAQRIRDYCEEQIAMFEQCETESKFRADEMIRRG